MVSMESGLHRHLGIEPGGLNGRTNFRLIWGICGCFSVLGLFLQTRPHPVTLMGPSLYCVLAIQAVANEVVDLLLMTS